MIPVPMPFLSKTTRDTRLIESFGHSLQGGGMHVMGNWGHLRKRVRKRLIGFGLSLDDLGEGLRKQSAWMGCPQEMGVVL